MKKDFKFIDELNNFIRSATEGGLISIWLKSYLFQYKYEHEMGTFKPLKLSHWYAILLIYGFIWMLTISAAIAEQIIYRKARKPNASRFWLYAEMAIDAERHFWLRHFELY